MSSRRDTSNRNQTFGRLLSGAINSIATYEGRTAPVIEEELGELLHLSGKTIQRYKAGYLPPEHTTVRVLAEAGVQRGYLNREWLKHFLRSARYPHSEMLLDLLCPLNVARERPQRIYNNLVAPTYSQFIMRQQEFAEVVSGLQQRSALVLIVGMGGNGKTSLAREVAAWCLRDNEQPALFDAAVWVSDKDRPGTTNLSIVLDEIARTLDYPGFTQYEHDEKLFEVGQLLKRQRVLIVIDNFETITDSALLTWLQRLPEPSKALVTSREYSRGFRNSTTVVELRGMSDAEARTFVGQHLRVLRMEQLSSSRDQLDMLIRITGANPKALKIALGLVKYERRPLQQVVDDLYAARGTLFEDLFARAWALLELAAQRVLLVATFFPTSADGRALSAAADVQGFAFDRALEQLVDLSLLDVQQTDLYSPPRYILHPLVQAFASAKLAGQADLEAAARQRWITWHLRLADQVGYCPNAVDRLHLLDAEHETCLRVMVWLSRHQRHAEVVQLGSGIMYFFYVRGLWDKWFEANLLQLEAARRLQDVDEELRALAYQVQTLSRQGSLDEAAMFRKELDTCIQGYTPYDETFFLIHHCMGAYYLAIDDFDAAQRSWETILAQGNQISHYRRVATQQWLGVCHFYAGRLKEAQSLFESALEEAMSHNYGRYILFNRLRLVAIKLEHGQIDQASDELVQCYDLARRLQDRWHLAYTQRTFSRLHLLRGDLPAARACHREAIDLFERLGMRRELAEAHADLADLDLRQLGDQMA
ncbi:MAG: hypothetical protein OHK0022_60880 [Roseiflexaceae bacterium]